MSNKTWIGKIWPFADSATSVVPHTAFEEKKIRSMSKLLGHEHRYLFEQIAPPNTTEVREFEGKLRGTAFGSVGMIQPNGSGPLPNKHGTFEIVIFTKAKRPEGFELRFQAQDCTVQDKAYYGLYCKAREIITQLARYAEETVVNPYDAVDIMLEREGLMYHVIFDELHFKHRTFEIDGKHHQLMLCMLVHKQEIEYARQHSSRDMMNLLKEKNIYPYSDLGRDATV